MLHLTTKLFVEWTTKPSLNIYPLTNMFWVY